MRFQLLGIFIQLRRHYSLFSFNKNKNDIINNLNILKNSIVDALD